MCVMGLAIIHVIYTCALAAVILNVLSEKGLPLNLEINGFHGHKIALSNPEVNRIM